MGKGGVGKTTLSAATALAAAEMGSRILLVSTDAAHSLGDALNTRLGRDPVRVTDSMDAVELDGRYELERSWSAIAEYARTLLGVAELDRLHTDELVVVPGLDQLLALTRLHRFVSDGDWDAIVVDCAPSADSLRLLSLPDVLDWYASRLFGRNGSMRSRVRRTLERTLSVSGPSNELVASVSDLSQTLAELRLTLREADTTARLVVTPERLVVAEAQRTRTYLALYGYRVDALLVNRVLDPAEAPMEWNNWHAQQARQLARLPDIFGSLPQLVCRLRPDEPIGVDALTAVGRELYQENDPLCRLGAGSDMAFTTEGPRAVLHIPVGGLTHDEIDLQRLGGELLLTLGSYRQTLTLPDGLQERDVVGATIVEGALRVEFAEGAHAAG